jgi:hypothetical protein
MSHTEFKNLSFEKGDIVVCVSATSRAPTGIVGHAFVLDALINAGPAMCVDGKDILAFQGNNATWRKATPQDADLVIHQITENWDTGWRFSKPTPSGETVGTFMKLEGYCSK